MLSNETTGVKQDIQDDMVFQYSLASFCLFMIFGKKICPLFLKHIPPYSDLKPEIKQQWNERTASSIHASFVTSQCIYLLLFEDAIKTNLVWGYSKLAAITLAVAVGYFVSDLCKVLMTFSRESDGDKVGYIVHHILSIYAFCYSLDQHLLSYFAIFRLLAEMSTPFVNLRWLLFISGFKSTKLYVYNGCVMTLAFFVSRILLMPFFYHMVFQVVRSRSYRSVSPTIHYSWLAVCVVLDVLNILWFKKMMAGVTKYLRHSPSKKA